MTVKECYDALGADYNDVIGRLMTDDRVKKYLLKYVEKSELASLEDAMQKKDWNAAFGAAHNMKGVALNLSLTRLAAAASDLCEMLRGGTPKGDTEPLFRRVKEEHEALFSAVKALS